MARFQYTRTIEHYSFTPPRFISESEYYSIKMKILQAPEEPLVKEEVAEKNHGRLTLILAVGIIALVIGLFGAFSNDSKPDWAMILILISIFGILHPLVNMGSYQSSLNRVKAERERILYFQHLKKMVASSNNYPVFWDNYRKIYCR